MELQCKVCKRSLNSIEVFVRHFELTHRVSAASKFVCGFQSCFLQFISREAYQRHVSDFHNTPSYVPNSKRTCHLPSVQAAEPPFRCSLEGCQYECNNKTTLRVHRKRKHSSSTSSAHAHAPLDISEAGASVALDCANETFEQFLEPFPENDVVDKPASDVVREKCLHLYLSLRSQYHVPESTLQYLISSLYSLARESSDILKEDLISKMSAKFGIEKEQLTGIVEDVLSSDLLSELHSPSGPLRSKYMRGKNYHSGPFTYVPIISHKLGLNAENEKRKFHTVSIKQSLQAMFMDDSIYEQYVQSATNGCSKDGVIRDMNDGLLFKTHPVLADDGSAIAIVLYEDDLEIVNSLGAARNKHKITAIEFTLANLKPWTRVKQHVIKLALLAAEKDVAYFGLSAVLEPVIKELKDLVEHGLEIRGKLVKVVVIVLLGDNLGTHTFTGFLENFSRSKYFCRYCEETRSEWLKRWYGQLQVIEEESDDESDKESECTDSDSDSDESSSSVADESDEPGDLSFGSSIANEMSVNDLRGVSVSTAPLRTPQTYDECVNAVEERKVDNVKGIVGKCALNDIKYFHCVGSSPPCLAHDMFEGVIAYDIALALHYFMETFLISPDFINRRIKKLKMCGSDKGDKPAPVNSGMKKLRGSAIQNWNCLRFLPLLIGDKIKNKQDRVWKMTLTLIELTRLLASPCILRSALPHISQKIQLYMRMRVDYFPKVPIRPKHHYLEHYPYLIELFGPLMRVSTLPFEMKHRFFKNTSHSRKNYKNVTKTLAEEHQLAQGSLSVDLLSCDYPLMENPCAVDSVIMCPVVKHSVLSYFGSECLKYMACAEKARFHGTLYSKGQAIVISSPSSSQVHLCIVEKILSRGQSCYAVGWRCRAELEPSWQYFTFVKSSTCAVVNLERISDYVSYPIYNVNGEDVVLLKHSSSC